jgi:putative hydrolase of the HAD superfamily
LLSDLKALLFDLDGTLYLNNDLGEEIHLSGCRYIAEVRGITPLEAGALIRETMNRLSAASGMKSTLSHACVELGGDLRELHRRFAEEIRPEGFLAPDARVVGLLGSLGTRFDLFIYTNNNITLSNRIMGLIGVAGLFSRVFSIEDYWRPKPDRTVLESIYRAIGRKPAECMFIGDRYDVDLRLPAEMGSTVFLCNSVEDMLSLNKLLYGEEM